MKRLCRARCLACFWACFWLIGMSIYTAQAKPADFVEFDEFEAKPLDGWEWDKDERLEDLVNQLREKESSLQALDARIAKAMGRKAGAKMDENMAWRSTRRVDLNGGGPIRWDAFYGRHAEKFFYHPVDPNTTYHTRTLLQQTDPLNAGGVPGNQGVPAHQRPPQFDYIYRGYEKEQERASGEMSKLASKMDVLTARRRQLENDVVILWFKLAFRVIDKEKLPEKAILRFAMVPKKQGKGDFERATALTSATQLLASALLFNEAFVEKEPDRAFRTLEAMIKKNRQKFEDGLLKAGTLLEESEDRGTSLGKYKLLTRKLEDVSKSISEGYRCWKDGDRAEDEPAKYASLRRVQDSVVTYSQILLSLNELAGVMKKDWVMGLNTDTPAFVPVWDVAYVAPPEPAMSEDDSSPSRADSTRPPALDKNAGLRKKFSAKTVDLRNGVLTLTYDFARREQLLKDFDLPAREDLVNAGKGILRIGASEKIVHVVEFKEGAMSGRFTYGNRDGHQFLMGTAGSSVRLDRLVGGTVDELRLELWSEGPFLIRQDIGYQTPLKIQWEVTENKVRTIVNGKELAGKRAVEKDVGQFSVWGGNGGLRVDAPLVISGVPKDGWLEGFLAE